MQNGIPMTEVKIRYNGTPNRLDGLKSILSKWHLVFTRFTDTASVGHAPRDRKRLIIHIEIWGVSHL